MSAVRSAVLRLFIFVAATATCLETSAQSTTFPAEPLMTNGYKVLDESTTSHVYSYDWFSSSKSLDLPADTVFVTEKDSLRYYITSAKLVGTFPDNTGNTGYSTKYQVNVTLKTIAADGTEKVLNRNYKYCSTCGRVTRQTPTITINGDEGPDISITYGDTLNFQTNAIDNTGGYTTLGNGHSDATCDGEELLRTDRLSAGTYEVKVHSYERGNNIFRPSKGTVIVGYKDLTRTFNVTVLPYPIEGYAAIATRDADGTANLGAITLTQTTALPKGGQDVNLSIAEIDSSAVMAKPGTYTVRYLLAVDNENYAVSGEWQEASFTIEGPIAPDPTSDPDFFGNPLINQAKVIDAETLVHVYDYDWYYTDGANLNIEDLPIELCAYGDGKINITSVRFDSSKTPTGYDTGLPILVTLSYTDEKNRTVAIDGDFTYCNDCGTLTRNTPTITINGSEDKSISLTYGDDLNFATNAAKCEAAENGTQITSTTRLAAGTHTISVTSQESGNNVFTPKTDAEVGYRELTKDFNVTVEARQIEAKLTFATRNADGTTALGKQTISLSTFLPAGCETPQISITEIDSSAVKAEAGTYAVQYRLAIAGSNYTISNDWQTAEFTITNVVAPDPTSDPDFFSNPLINIAEAIAKESLSHVYDYDWYFTNGADLDIADLPIDLCKYGDGRLSITSARFDSSKTPTGYNTGLPILMTLSYTDEKNRTVAMEGDFTYCDDCGTLTRNTPTITINGSEDTSISLTYGDDINYATNAQVTYTGDAGTEQTQTAKCTASEGSTTISRTSRLPVGTHSITVTSAEVGNNAFTPKASVAVGYSELSKDFLISIAARPIEASLSISSRKVDSTNIIGEKTITLATELPAGCEVPDVTIAEIDSSAVKAEAGTYTVRYRLATSNSNYSISDEWHTTSFTITAAATSEPEPEQNTVPDPTSDPDFFGNPLINQAEVIDAETLVHVYDYDWYYTDGANLNIENLPIELCAYGDGKISITSAHFNTQKIPTGYNVGQPILVALSYTDADGKTSDIEGDFTYCDDCGTVTRNTPTITANGSEGPDIYVTYGDDIDYVSNANVSYITSAGNYESQGAGCKVYLDGERIGRDTRLAVGTHTVSAFSKEIGNTIFTPKERVGVGYIEMTKEFNIIVSALEVDAYVTIASRKEDGTTTLGETTITLSTTLPSGCTDPQITISETDLSSVSPTAGTYEVRYRLSTSSSNYSISNGWRTTTFTITAGEVTPDPEPDPEPDDDCLTGIVHLKFGNTLIVDNSEKLFKACQWNADGEPIFGATKQYYHKNPLATASYTVTLTLTDGSTATSCPISIEEQTQKSLTITAYPNPVKSGETLTIEISGATAEDLRHGTIEAYNISGERIAELSPATEIPSTQLSLPSGVYAIKVTVGDETAETKIIAK